jgi:uncharacterized membrane protein YoaK (UPF0700 family)
MSSTKTGVSLLETLAISLPLTVVGGFLDTYTYVTRGGVFANAQTGNMVLLAIHTARGEWATAAYYLIPILSFALGVVVTEGIRARAPHRAGVHWQRSVLLLEAAILGVVGFLPKGVPDAVVNVAVSFLCAMQVNSFRTVMGLPYASTMCTGNLRSCSQHFWQFLFGGDREAGAKAWHYLSVILVFCLGAGLGIPLTSLLGERSVLLGAVVLLGVWLRLLVDVPAIDKASPLG